VNERQFDDLLAAAEDGVSFDGLHVAQTPDGYDLETPETAQSDDTELDAHTLARSSLHYNSICSQ